MVRSGRPPDADLEALDSIIAGASAAIDAGDYSSALYGFRQAIVLARDFFGESLELAELSETVEDIERLIQNSECRMQD